MGGGVVVQSVRYLWFFAYFFVLKSINERENMIKVYKITHTYIFVYTHTHPKSNNGISAHPLIPGDLQEKLKLSNPKQ